MYDAPLTRWRDIWTDHGARGVYVFTEVSARGTRVHKVGSGVLLGRVATQNFPGCNRVVVVSLRGMALQHRDNYQLLEWWIRQTLHVAVGRELMTEAQRLAEPATARPEAALVARLRPTFEDIVAALADGLRISRDRLLDCRVHPPGWYPRTIRTKAQRRTYDYLRLMHRAALLIPGDLFVRRFAGLPPLRLQVGDDLLFSDGANAPGLPRPLLDEHLKQLPNTSTKRDAWRELRLVGQEGESLLRLREKAVHAARSMKGWPRA